MKVVCYDQVCFEKGPVRHYDQGNKVAPPHMKTKKLK